MAKDCETCVYESNFKANECGTCSVSYLDGVQQGKPTNYKAKLITYADRIRAMSEAEFAEFWISRMTYCECCAKKGRCSADGVDYAACIDGVKEWLKQPAEVEE